MAKYRILEGIWFVPDPDDSSGNLGEGTSVARVQKNPGDIIELLKPPSAINEHKLQLLSEKSEAKNVKTTGDPKDGKVSDKPPADATPTTKGAKVD